MKHKNEALTQFRERIALAEKQSSRKVKKLETDNGLEYLNHEFIVFCKQQGIQRKKVVLKTLQQNGLAERINKILLERVR